MDHHWNRTAVLAAVAVAGLGVTAWLAGSFGYGLAYEYGGLGGGLWQLDVVAAVVLGTVLAGVLELAGRFVARRRGVFRWAAPLAVGLCLLAVYAGAAIGSARHDRQTLAADEACLHGMAERMTDFADAMRPPGSPYRSEPQGTPAGCVIDIAVPRSVTDPARYVQRRFDAVDYERVRYGTWRSGDVTVWLGDGEAEDPDAREYLLEFVGIRPGAAS
jgi:hypothetical protein